MIDWVRYYYLQTFSTYSIPKTIFILYSSLCSSLGFWVKKFVIKLWPISCHLKVWSLEKTVITVEKIMSYVILVKDTLCIFFYKNGPKVFYDAKLIFRSFATFFGLAIFTSGAKQKIYVSLKPKCKNLGSWDPTYSWLIGHSSITNFWLIH